MMTRADLVTLHRSLCDERVLSVYIDGEETDPAHQRTWRLQLEHGLHDVRRWLDESSRAERGDFERCVLLLDALIADFDGAVGAPGWAAFITSDRVHVAHELPAAAPTLAVWSNGPCVSPYIRSLKEERSVVVVVADARRATLYCYQLGTLERVEDIRAHHVVDHPEHMGTPAGVGFHAGTRGRTGHDAAQRTLLQGRERMIAEISERSRELAGADGWILIGGIKRVAARIHELLEQDAAQRVLAVNSLGVHAAESEIAEIARTGASRLRDSMDERRIAHVADAAAAHGLGAIGSDDTMRALEQACVHDLYFTHRALERHAAETERAVRAAFDQDASVEEVSGSAADLLNAQGGMAAGLRFRPAALETVTAL